MGGTRSIPKPSPCSCALPFSSRFSDVEGAEGRGDGAQRRLSRPWLYRAVGKAVQMGERPNGDLLRIDPFASAYQEAVRRLVLADVQWHRRLVDPWLNPTWDDIQLSFSPPSIASSSRRGVDPSKRRGPRGVTEEMKLLASGGSFSRKTTIHHRSWSSRNPLDGTNRAWASVVPRTHCAVARAMLLSAKQKGVFSRDNT
jgi:hypothetical protein